MDIMIAKETGVSNKVFIHDKGTMYIIFKRVNDMFFIVGARKILEPQELIDFIETLHVRFNNFKKI